MRELTRIVGSSASVAASRARQSTIRLIVGVLVVSAFVAAVVVGGANGQGRASPSCAPSERGGNLCVLGNGSPAWNTSTSGGFNLAGDLFINGKATSTAPVKAAGRIGLTETVNNPGNWRGLVNTSSPEPPQTNQPPQADPYANASVAHLSCSPSSAYPSSTGNTTRTLDPGGYSDITAGGGTWTLKPGVYTITGNFTNNGATIIGEGVTLYLCPSAQFRPNNGLTTLSAPGGPTDFVIFADRANTGDALNFQTGNNKGERANLTGVVYAPFARLYRTGGANVVINVQGDVVVGRIYWSGGGTLNVTAGTPPPPPTTGSFEVIKTITGPAAAERGVVKITVSCAGHQVNPETIEIRAGETPEPVEYRDIPAGTECTVTETSDGETQTVAASVTREPANGTVTIEAGALETVEVTDHYTSKETPPPDTGSLKVIKSITGEAAQARGRIRIRVSCGDHPLTPNPIVIRARATPSPVEYTGIPAGTECTVDETRNGHTRRVDVKVTISHDGHVTIPANDTATVELTNDYTFIPGKLTVKKTIIGLANEKHGGIRIEVKCGSNELAPIVIASDQTGTDPTTYNDIPAGTTCTVTEVKDGRTSTVDVKVTHSPGGGIVTIPANGTATVEVTNEYRPAPGSLLVTKTIAGPAAGQQGQVVIGVTCDATPLEDFVIPAGTPPGSPLLERTYPNIRAGAICEVKETADGQTTTVTAAVTGGGKTTVPAGAQATLGVTDSYSSVPGTLVVNKTITGRAAGFEGAVTIHVECTGTPPLPDFTIPAGAPAGTTSHTYTGIPAGATCTLTEPEDGHTDIVQVTVTGDHEVTIPSNGVATANLVDTYTDGTGKLRVEKSITGPGAGRQGAVRIAVSCNGTALPDFVVAAGTSAGTRSHTYENIPADATCTVNETVNGRTSSTAVRVTGDDRVVTIPHGGTATAEIRDNYTRIRGSLTVQKTIRGPGAGHRGTVRIKVICGGKRLPNFVVGVGRGRGTFSRTYGNIPAGTTCTVTETHNGRTARASVRVAGSGQRARIPANSIATLGLTGTYFGRRAAPRPPSFTG